MTASRRWDPADHPRSPIGRFISVSPSGRGLPPSLRSLQNQYRDFDPDYAIGRGRGDEISRAYHSGRLWSGEPLSRMSGAQRAAVLEYQLDSNEINGALRAGDATEEVEHIDAAIARNRLSQDTVVYRGVDSSLFDDVRPGDQIEDRGYSSTSLDPSITREFGDTMLEIELPEGTEVAPLSRLGADEWGHQAELLVGRGSVIEIDEVTPAGRPGVFDPSTEARVIRARLVGYTDPKQRKPKPETPAGKYPAGLAPMQVVTLAVQDGKMTRQQANEFWNLPDRERKKILRGLQG